MTSKKQKRELEIGLANNAFGAGAGIMATRMALANSKVDPETMIPHQPKPKASLVGRGLKKIKVRPKVAAGVAGAALVGSQALNAALDAQSAQYFGRERAKVYMDERRNKRGTGVGTNIAKRGNYDDYDSYDVDRARRAGRAEAFGGVGATAAGIGGAGMLVHGASREGIKSAGQDSKKMLQRVFQPKKAFAGTKDPIKNRRLAVIAGAGGLAAAPVLAAGTKRFSRESRERWQ